MQEEKDIEEYTEYTDTEEIPETGFKAKIISFLTGVYFVPIAIVLVAVIAFSLGRVSGLEEKREPVRVIDSSKGGGVSIKGQEEIKGEVKGAAVEAGSSTGSTSSEQVSSGQVVGSKNGTKYHYPWCAGAKQISEKNLITFESIEAARAKGYTPASNCKGLK